MMTEERFHEAESRDHTCMDYAEARKKSHEMQQRIEWLLELQELTDERAQSDTGINSAERGGRRQSQHPKQPTDERQRVGDGTPGMQLQQILADDEMRRLVRQLGFAKRAFKHDELTNDTPDVDAEWEKFAASHIEALAALDEEKAESRGLPLSGRRAKPSSLFALHFPARKAAASFIGVLLASGIAFAAIQIVLSGTTPNPQTANTKQPTDVNPVISLPTDTVKADTITLEPYVFDNVPLDSMLAAIAAAHQVQVEFENEAARQLRFHFVWKREDSLARVVEKLNTFEAVNIGIEDKKLVVR